MQIEDELHALSVQAAQGRKMVAVLREMVESGEFDRALEELGLRPNRRQRLKRVIALVKSLAR